MHNLSTLSGFMILALTLLNFLYPLPNPTYASTLLVENDIILSHLMVFKCFA